jgi:uncharacterized protein (TIGR00730 family)
MGALNRAALAEEGKVVGVVHERMVDGDIMALETAGMKMLMATGDTLEERKRLLSQHADCFIALPGGPGTWEELWEMASIESLGLLPIKRPVVLVNTDNYYAGFVIQLHQAHKDGLLHKDPDEIIQIVATPAEALAYVTAHPGGLNTPASVVVNPRKARL